MITKSRSFSLIAWALFLVLSTDLWVLGQTAGPVVSDADLAVAIEKETGQPPQLVLDFVREHPYTRQALLDAAARTGVDVNTLSAIFFAEFNVTNFLLGQKVKVAEDGKYVTHTVSKEWNLLDGAAGGLDSFSKVGIDAFAEEAPRLKRRGLLPPDLTYAESPEVIKNELGMSLRPVFFNNLRDTIAALAAVARGRQDRAQAKLTELGIAEPSFEELTAATYLYYNAANSGRWLAAAKGSPGGVAKLGRVVPSWRKRLLIRSALQNAGRVLATALLFKRAGVFAPAEEQTSDDDAVAQGEARPEALGAIKKLAGAAK